MNKLLICTIMLVCFCCSTIDGQKKITIKGVVTNATEEGISDVQFYVDMKRVRETTNNKGKYKLKVLNSAQLITVYHPDYGFINWDNLRKRKINFVFPEGSDPVNIEKMKDLGYDTELPPTYKQQLYASYNSIFEILDKTFPQVRVINGQIYIGRGGPNSVTSDPDPLILVDGIPRSATSLETIATNEVKDIKVIHRGSETAEYGIRGLNGVILVSLKTGEDG